MFTRRILLASAIAAGAAPAFAATPFRSEVDEIEARLGGRIGATWLGPGGGTWTGHRQDERFLMCSTFKAFLAAATLQKARCNAFGLSDNVTFAEADLVANSPALKPRLSEGGVSRAELCEAAIAFSDNTAANLLLRDLGGPEALTRFMRRLGDDVTRMDRTELALNMREAPDDIRDTSTPLVFARSLHKVLFGGGLAPADARQLADWMRACRNQPSRIRAGVPTSWDIGVKPGTSADEIGVCNDVGFFTRPGHRTQLLVVFVEAPNASSERRQAAIADIARIVATRG